MTQEDCIFCQIIERKTPAKIVYEDDKTIAFLDVDPVSEGHTLVIPKAHGEDIFAVNEEYLISTISTVKKVADRLMERLAPDGMNIMQNNRKAASQVIPHYHVHIIPRWLDDGIKILHIQAPPQKDLFGMLDETLNKIKF